MSDRLPPHNIEAEESVLGSCLIDQAVIDDVCQVIRPEDFYRDGLAEIYRAILEMRADGLPIDALSVDEHLTQKQMLRKVGGEEAVVRLLKAVPHAANALHYAGIVRS